MVVDKEKIYDRLYSDDFDNFRSNVCHFLKNNGDIKFVYYILKSDIISLFYDKKLYKEAFYMLAALDYISKVNNIPLCTKYTYLRQYRFEETIWPQQAELVCMVMNDDSFKDKLLKKANPEFLQYNIVEGDMRDVC